MRRSFDSLRSLRMTRIKGICKGCTYIYIQRNPGKEGRPFPAGSFLFAFFFSLAHSLVFRQLCIAAAVAQAPEDQAADNIV